jgi:hypothetical protein
MGMIDTLTLLLLGVFAGYVALRLLLGVFAAPMLASMTEQREERERET